MNNHVFRRKSIGVAIVQFLGIGAVIYAMFGMSGCGLGPGVRGSGVAKTETREVDAFTRVEGAGSADIAIETGARQSVVVETDDNILPLIDTTVKGDKLVITSHGTYSTRLGVKITIVVPVLDEARISGSGNITASGVSGKGFAAHISGSGNIRVSGSTDSLTASIAGSGSIDASKLPAGAADVQVTGSGNIKVVATQSLHAEITGSGDVRYGGNPARIQKRVTGSGNVRTM